MFRMSKVMQPEQSTTLQCEHTAQDSVQNSINSNGTPECWNAGGRPQLVQDVSLTASITPEDLFRHNYAATGRLRSCHLPSGVAGSLDVQGS